MYKLYRANTIEYWAWNVRSRVPSIVVAQGAPFAQFGQRTGLEPKHRDVLPPHVLAPDQTVVSLLLQVSYQVRHTNTPPRFGLQLIKLATKPRDGPDITHKRQNCSNLKGRQSETLLAIVQLLTALVAVV